MIKQYTIKKGEGKHCVNLFATLTSEGIIIQLYGGEKPHVGAVVLSIPRPSLKNPEKISCNSIVVPLIGHKDDKLAKPVAEKVVRFCGAPVVAIAGLHIENASAADISLLKKNTFRAVDHFLKAIDPSA